MARVAAVCVYFLREGEMKSLAPHSPWVKVIVLLSAGLLTADDDGRVPGGDGGGWCGGQAEDPHRRRVTLGDGDPGREGEAEGGGNIPRPMLPNTQLSSEAMEFNATSLGLANNWGLRLGK